MPTTGKLTNKRYKCSQCGRESDHSTNHYGEIYPLCPKCGTVTVHQCLEPLPEGWTKPEPWKIVKLGDVAQITVGHPRRRKMQ